MHGGYREGSGRKIDINKKQPVTIYLNINDRELIENLPLPDCNSFSQKCRRLLEMGIEKLESELKTDKNEITFIDLFSGLGGFE